MLFPSPHAPTITVLSEPTLYDTGLLNMQGEKITRAAPRNPAGFVWFPDPLSPTPHTRSNPDEEI